MSGDRRRRKSNESACSDDLSDPSEELNTTKEEQNRELNEDHHDSEYDTAGSESEADFQDKTPRENGDGQEEEKLPKKLDDDEDRRNPQYIPKRGTFYEHDDRTADEINEGPVEEKPEREVKDKKVWKDKEDKWDHDRYNDEEQAPKSHAELIAVYGYDIRNEEGPPRARRRRRYGRGPNKYTRNWEDGDAYGKVGGNVPIHKPNYKKPSCSGEEFPLLNVRKNDNAEKTEEKPVFTSAWYSNKTKQHSNKNQNYPSLQQSEGQKTLPEQLANALEGGNKVSSERNNVWTKESKNTLCVHNPNETSLTAMEADKKIVLLRTMALENKNVQPQEFMSSSIMACKGRGRGFKANTNNNVVETRTKDSKPKNLRPGGSTNTDNTKVHDEQEQIMKDFKHVNLSLQESSYNHHQRQNKQFYNQASSQQHTGVVNSRMQPSLQQQHQQQQASSSRQQLSQQAPQLTQQQDLATSRPKRYSSLRQRPSMPEGPTTSGQPNYPPAPPQHAYYPAPPAQGYAPSPYEQQAPVPPPGQPVMQIPPPGAQPTPSYVPHTHAPPPFLVPPPQFIASQTAPPNIINYVPGPNGHIFQPNYQSYSPSGVPVNLEVHNLEPGPPTQEVPLYQPQGCTYYNPAQQQQQQQQQQSVPLRRPKAAIPILPPPENSRSRNRHSQQDQHQQEQMIQQQQHQEQLVQQQLQQHQQQLIQQQQQELQHQRQEKLQQQKMKQYPLEQKKKQLEKDLMLQEDDRVTVNDFRSSTFVAKDNQVNLVEEKLRDVNLNDQSAAVEQLKAHSKVDFGKGDEKELLSKDETVSTSTAEEKFNNLVSHAVDNSQETGEAEDNSESNCSVQDDALINHVI